MKFYVVEENMAPAPNEVIGYFQYAWAAFAVMEESPDRRVVQFELDKQTHKYEPTRVWEHPDNDED